MKRMKRISNPRILTMPEAIMKIKLKESRKLINDFEEHRLLIKEEIADEKRRQRISERISEEI